MTLFLNVCSTCGYGSFCSNMDYLFLLFLSVPLKTCQFYKSFKKYKLLALRDIAIMTLFLLYSFLIFFISSSFFGLIFQFFCNFLN